MNIYLLEQSINDDYDTYDSCVVIAENEPLAREIHPSPYVTHNNGKIWMGTYSGGKRQGEYEQDESGWVKFDRISEISITLIGRAAEGQTPGVVCASFNAG